MAIIQNNETGSRAQVNNVQAVGVDAEFWKLAGTAIELGRREVALNQHLAQSLGAKVGDTVALRIPKPGLLSRDAPLSSREEETSARANFTVKAIAGDDQFGRFSLAREPAPTREFFSSTLVTCSSSQILARRPICYLSACCLLFVSDGRCACAILGSKTCRHDRDGTRRRHRSIGIGLHLLRRSYRTRCVSNPWRTRHAHLSREHKKDTSIIVVSFMTAVAH